MPTIDSAAEATQVANLISAGKLTGSDKDSAMAALRAFDAQQSDRRPDAPAGTFVDPHTGQPVTTSQPGNPVGGNWLSGAFDRVSEPVRRAAAGAGQLGALTMGGPGNPTAVSQQATEDARQAAYNTAHPGDSSAANDAVAGAVSAAVPLGASTETTTWLRAIAKGMRTGASASGLQYTQDGDSKLEQMGVGGVAGGMFAGLAGALPAGKNLVTRAVRRAEDGSSRVRQVVEAAKGFFQGSAAVPAPLDYTIPQKTGDPVMTRLAGRAFGPKQQEFGAQQSDEVKARFQEIADQAEAIAKQPASSQGVASAVNTALNDRVSAMRTVKNNAFKKGMTDVLKLDSATPAGTRLTIPLDNLEAAYQEAQSQDANAFNIHGEALPSGFKEALEALQQAKASGSPGVRVVTLQKIMQGLGQGADHNGGAFLSPEAQQLERYRRMLFDGLQKDIDGAGVTAAKNPAYAKLLDVRKTYAQHSDQIRQVENDSITRLFGSPENVQNPQAALDQFYKLKPDDQKFAVDLIGKQSPETLRAMQAHQIRTAIQEATPAAAAKDSDFDLATFNKIMFGQGRGDSPLWNAGGVTAAQVRAGGAHLKVLLNAAPAGGGSLIGAEDVAINVMSRNPAFAARMFTRAAYQKNGDQLLGTPEGLAALRTLSNTTNRTSQAFAAALSYVTNLARSGGGTDPNAQPQ